MNYRDTTNETATLWSVDAIEDIEFIESAYKEAFKNALIAQIGSTYSPSVAYVIWGCVNSGTNPNPIIGAGAMFFNGEIYTVGAASFGNGGANVSVCSITDVSDGNSRLFNDNNLYPVTRVRQIAIATGASGSGTANYSTVVFLKDKLDIGNVVSEIDSCVSGSFSGSEQVLCSLVPSASNIAKLKVVFSGCFNPNSFGASQNEIRLYHGGTTTHTTGTINGSLSGGTLRKAIRFGGAASAFDYYTPNFIDLINYVGGELITITGINIVGGDYATLFNQADLIVEGII